MVTIITIIIDRLMEMNLKLDHYQHFGKDMHMMKKEMYQQNNHY